MFDRHVTRWNDNCVFCHNVAPNPGRDPSTGDVQDHGRRAGDRVRGLPRPGRRARARQRRSVAALRASPRRRAPIPTIVNPSRLAPARAADLCGRCHGQRITADVGPFLAHGDPFVAGDDLARYSRAARARHAAARRRGRVRRALLGGRHAAPDRLRIPGPVAVGVRAARAASPAPAATACTRAIRAARSANASRPRTRIACARSATRALAAPAALGAHTHHDPAGEGARCVGCHMPRIVYGVLDIHRSHRIEIPKPPRADRPPQLTPRPDACTLCHVEGVPGGQAGVGATLAAARGRARRARGRGRRAGPRAVVRRRRARAPARDAARGDGRAIAIRPSATSPGGACAGWSRPAPRPARGWPPTTIPRPTPRRACGSVTRCAARSGRAAGAADSARDGRVARDVDLEIGE